MLANGNVAVYSREQLEQIISEDLPDIYTIFKAYNAEYFDNKINGFEIRWGPRLLSVAGKIEFWPKKRITISKMLHIGRTHKIMIETLLHEMIHAYLYCTYERHPERHGESYIRVMTETNLLSNLNVTIIDEGGLDHVAHLQARWECTRCRKQIIRFFS